jgi:threonine synthase
MGLKEKMTLEKFEEACEAVGQVTLDTSLIYSDYFSERTGGKVYLKPENRQRTGAYKVRGAYYKISTLSDEERAKGLITASAGNHAQGVAYAAKRFGAKAVIVMPTTTPLIKVNRTKALGAEVVLHGDVYDEACARALELAPIAAIFTTGTTATRLYRKLCEPVCGMPCTGLPSTSPANAAWSLERLLEAYRPIRTIADGDTLS